MRAVGSLAVLCLLCATPALAGLEICNFTDQEQSVAIGHQVDDTWTSEGWWNIASGDCTSPVEGDLTNRYYYYRAEVPGGTFDGDGYTFCITDDLFTIAGQDACQARGYESAGFAVIDTGQTATQFTLTLVPPEDLNAAPAAKEEPTKAPAPAYIPADTWISGFAKGTAGEPFTQTAMFQGCGAIDGARYCAFFADGWKWYAYYGGPTPASFLDQLYELVPGVGVEIEGDILNYGDISLEIALSAVTVSPAALEYRAEVDALQGPWVSMDDANYTIEFVGGELYESYPGTQDDVYFWRFATTCDMAPPTADLALIKTVPESQEQECWLPDVITADRLEFVNPGRGNILSFRRP